MQDDQDIIDKAIILTKEQMLNLAVNSFEGEPISPLFKKKYNPKQLLEDIKDSCKDTLVEGTDISGDIGCPLILIEDEMEKDKLIDLYSDIFVKESKKKNKPIPKQIPIQPFLNELTRIRKCNKM